MVGRTFDDGGLQPSNIEASLGAQARAVIAYAPSLIVGSMTRGEPFVLRHPEAPASLAIKALARVIA